MADNKLKELNTKRGSIKGRVTKFSNYLDTVLSLQTVSDVEMNKLAMKLTRIEALFIEFDELQSQIEMLNESNLETELITRDLIEQEFDNCISLSQNFLQSQRPPSKKDQTDISSCAHSNGCNHHSHDDCDNLGFKLPIIKIPNFDGTYYKWLEFKEIYCSLIHDNPKIKNIHKFHYLCSYLEGEASRVICNLEASDKNYNEAWALLCNRFDNKRQLINNHLKSSLNFESTKETDRSLRFIIDHVTKNLRALSTLGLPTEQWDVLIIYILTTKLDTSTNFKWEEHRNSLSEIPSLNDFFSFLKNRADVFETVNRAKSDNKYKSYQSVKQNPATPQPKFATKAFIATSQQNACASNNSPLECAFCKGKHRLYECSAFKAKAPEERNTFAISMHLCLNCLRPGHVAQNCKLTGSCRSCKKRHNSLLHVADKAEPPSIPETISMSALSSSETLLCTAQVQLSNPNTNETITVRALLDSGSQSSFITESVKLRLNLSPQPINVSIVGIGNNLLPLNTERCSIHLKSNVNSFKVSMFCLVLKTISEQLPKTPFDISQLDLAKFNLADPNFSKPAPIDMLIGADLFWDLIGSEQHSLGKNNPSLRSSKLGWLISGPLSTYPKSSNHSNRPIMCNFLLKEDNLPNLSDNLAKFWELENVPQAQPYTKDEKLCERLFALILNVKVMAAFALASH